eukprot:1142640-Pelagomonas_calceolata.AAC.4
MTGTIQCKRKNVTEGLLKLDSGQKRKESAKLEALGILQKKVVRLLAAPDGFGDCIVADHVKVGVLAAIWTKPVLPLLLDSKVSVKHVVRLNYMYSMKAPFTRDANALPLPQEA